MSFQYPAAVAGHIADQEGQTISIRFLPPIVNRAPPAGAAGFGAPRTAAGPQTGASLLARMAGGGGGAPAGAARGAARGRGGPVPARGRGG